MKWMSKFALTAAGFIAIFAGQSSAADDPLWDQLIVTVCAGGAGQCCWKSVQVAGYSRPAGCSSWPPGYIDGFNLFCS